MANARVRDLFGNIEQQISNSVILDAQVCCCDLNSQDRTLKMRCLFSEYVCDDEIVSLSDTIKNLFLLKWVKIDRKFSSNAFGDTACADIIKMLNKSNVVLQGFLNDADFSYDNTVLSIDLKYGGLDSIKKLNFIDFSSFFFKYLPQNKG